MVEGDFVAGRQGCEIRVIRHDERDFDGELSHTLPEQQIVETVPNFRDHDHDPRLRGIGAKFIVHRQRRGDMLELLQQFFEIQCRWGLESVVGPEVHAHEERAGHCIAILLRVHNVKVVLCEEAGDGVHDAGAVRAGERQSVFVLGGHDGGVVEVGMFDVGGSY